MARAREMREQRAVVVNVKFAVPGKREAKVPEDKTPPQQPKTAETAPVHSPDQEVAEGSDDQSLEQKGDPGEEFTDWLKAERESKAGTE